MCEYGMVSWETLARECLQYMSEDDVQDMSHVFTADFADDEEDYDD
jgi:hypothetical protein